MIYEYNNKVVNLGNENDFFHKKKFVGYLLPDGSIYECKDHNIENVSSFLKMSLSLMKEKYADRDEFLDADTNSPLISILLKYMKKVSYEEVLALSDFIDKNNLSISDLLVQLFGCHLVTRMNKTILTSLNNHDVFYNYLLNGFTINTLEKIVYDENKKCFYFQKGMNQNMEMYSEIENIQKDSFANEIELFHK